MKTVVKGLCLVVFFSLSNLAYAGNADLEQEIQANLKDCQGLVKLAIHSLTAGKTAASELAELQSLVESIRINDLLLQERLADTEGDARELGTAILARQQQAGDVYRSSLDAFYARVEALPQASELTAADLRPLQNLLEQLVQPPDLPVWGALPYQRAALPAAPPLASPVIVPAHLGGDGAATEADTRAASEVEIIPEIAALAESLDWNPVRIYQWVSENVATEWYWGSMKGAAETLRQKSGNDADQAALLIALMRSANFPARYVRGVVEFFPDLEQARKLTGLTDPMKIAQLLQQAGIPFEPVIAGGRLANFRFEHLWVETEVPYSNYRGAILDPYGKIWIALDTSLKPAGYTWHNSSDPGAGFDFKTARNNYLNAPQEQTPLDALREQLAGHAGLDLIGLDAARRSKTLVPQPLDILPASLQFKPIAVTGEYAALPETLRHTFALQVTSSAGQSLLEVAVPLQDVTSRKVLLSFEPETVEDQQTVNHYGGLDNTPAYLVHLRPVLVVEGERLAVGSEGLPMGSQCVVTTGFVTPAGSVSSSNTQVVGNLAALGIVAQQASLPSEQALEDQDAGALLSGAALAYIDSWNQAEAELAELLGIELIRPVPTLVTLGSLLDVVELFGSPRDLLWKGVYIDAGLRRVEAVAADGRKGRDVEFMRWSALHGSVLEDRLFTDRFQVEGISTAKLLGIANVSGVALLTLNSTNLESQLSLLPLGNQVKTDLRNAVDQGYEVTIPSGEIDYQQWHGIGYLKEDPKTGAAGYMLSGMIAGGTNAEEWAADYIRDVLESPYAGLPNNDPLAAAHIVKIPVGDRETGVVGEPHAHEFAVLVTDLKGRPVRGAEVTFNVKAGGGSYAGAPTQTVQTGTNGIAKVVPTLGQKTALNPSYKITDDGPNPNQVGVNLYSARVESHYGPLTLAEPFVAYARPGAPATLVKLLGDGSRGLPNNPGGSLSVRVEDMYQNPVANVPVAFAVTGLVSLSPDFTLPAAARSLELYLSKECSSQYPLYGDCSTTATLTLVSTVFGASVETIMGNTVNTEYTVSVRATEIPGDSFKLSTTGSARDGGYAPPLLLVSGLALVNERGQGVNATKVETALRRPLEAVLVLEYQNYSMVKETCSKKESGNTITYDCWRVVGDGLVQSERILDGTVDFSPDTSSGTGGQTANLTPTGDGYYRASFTAAKVPGLARITAKGYAEVSIPSVNFDPETGKSILTGYTEDTLPNRTKILRTGQIGLFHPETKELSTQGEQSIAYEVYGVDVPTVVTPDYALLNYWGKPDDHDLVAREDVNIDYRILPQSAAGQAGYTALRAEVDLLATDAAGAQNWVGTYIGDALSGEGGLTLSYGTPFDLTRSYHIRTVLNRGSDVEIVSDPVPVKLLLVDLDIDSDNNAGWNEDGTHNLPNRDQLEDQAEAFDNLPGKAIQPNLLDVDKDKVPGFADGINKFGNEGEKASAPFVPVLVEIAGNVDLSMAKVRFDYSASDPSGVTRTGSEADGYTYVPAPGSLRIWTKDGGQNRRIADIANNGDYIAANHDYLLNQLGNPVKSNVWKLYIEGVAAPDSIDTQTISMTIDVDGDGPRASVGDDTVKTSVLMASLVADYNHDRKIDEDDRKRALSGDTFYYWINNDDDQGETEGSDVPLSEFASEQDARNSVVDGLRDLIDFFPISIHGKAIFSIFDPDRYTYKIGNKEHTINFLETNLVENESGKYLTNVDKAKEIASLKVNGVYKPGGVFYVDSKLSTDFLAGAKNLGSGIVLIEGIERSRGDIYVDVYDKYDIRVFTVRMDVSLDNVEQMFRHKNLIKVLKSYYQDNYGQPGLPDHDPVPDKGEPDRLAAEDFINKIHFEGFDAESDENNFVHVHGYNVNDQDARAEQCEAFKRLYWSGSKSRFWAITWYGWDSQSTSIIPGIGTRSPNYHVNVRHAFKSGKLLKNFVVDTGLEHAAIFGHSLGNMVIASAIREGMPIGIYLMVNAAVAEEAYTPLDAYDGGYENGSNWRNETKESMYHPAWRYPDGVNIPLEQGYNPYLWASEWYKLFIGSTSEGRASITWRNIFEEVRNRDTYVYYAPTDEAFRPFNYTIEMAADDPGGVNYQANIVDWPGWEDVVQNWSPTNHSKLGTYSWAVQELLKGRMRSLPFPLGDKDSDAGGWGFNLADEDYWRYDLIQNKILPIISFEANKIRSDQLKSRPFFLINPDHKDIYSDEPVQIAPALQEELLANEVPALTFAAGHRGVGAINRPYPDRHVDIRNAFLRPGTSDSAPWPGDRPRFEWRHSDIYVVAYPYLFGLYDEWVNNMQGVPK